MTRPGADVRDHSAMVPSLLPLLLAAAFAAPVQDPELKAPAAGAPALTPFQWKSAAGLRFAWCLPKDYDGKTARNLTVILHGTGGDYRWGFLNNQPGIFRPDDVVVSVDGTSPGPNDSRLFLGEEKDAKAFHEFLAELRTLFKADRIFLYGHSQGGFFVVYFAGLHPEDVAGVCAHASGAWSGGEMGKKAQSVAIAFLHGTADDTVGYGNSSGSYLAYAEARFPMLLLRRMPGYSHWPNAVRATECLDWCEAMTTQNPERALALAKELLRPKGPDEYQYDIPPAFGAARQVLRRFSGDGRDPFGNLPPMVQGHAAEVAAAVEKLAAGVGADLDKEIGKKLALPNQPPIAALLAFRADFRGVDAAERWAKKLDLDKEIVKQGRAAEPVYKAWYAEKMADGERFAAIVAALAECWLHDGFPAELAERLDEWQGKQKDLKLDKKSLKAYDEVVEPWKEGWTEGWKIYERAVAGWKVPK